VIGHARSGEHYARVVRESLPGEPFIDALVRIAVEDAMQDCGSANQTSMLLGVSRQTVGRHVERARTRRMNAQLGRPDLNKTQRGQWTPARLAASKGAA